MSIFEQMNIRIVETKRRTAECRRKRKANKPINDLESSSDEKEELKDRPNTSSSSEEGESGEREDTPRIATSLPD